MIFQISRNTSLGWCSWTTMIPWENQGKSRNSMVDVPASHVWLPSPSGGLYGNIQPSPSSSGNLSVLLCLDPSSPHWKLWNAGIRSYLTYFIIYVHDIPPFFYRHLNVTCSGSKVGALLLRTERPSILGFDRACAAHVRRFPIGNLPLWRKKNIVTNWDNESKFNIIIHHHYPNYPQHVFLTF